MSSSYDRSFSNKSDKSPNRIQENKDNKNYIMLPTDGTIYTGSLKGDNFICPRCNSEKGHFDTILRHYSASHQKEIKEDLYYLATPQQYLSTLARAQINMLISKKNPPERTYKQDLNNLMIDMLFREKTVNLMHDYDDGMFPKESTRGFCPIKTDIIQKYISKYKHHLEILERCIKDIVFVCPITENSLNGINAEDIKEFFELNYSDSNSQKAIFFLANFDKNAQEIDQNKREERAKNRQREKTFDLNNSSDNDDEDEDYDIDEDKGNRKNRGKSSVKKKKSGTTTEIKVVRKNNNKKMEINLPKNNSKGKSKEKNKNTEFIKNDNYPKKHIELNEKEENEKVRYINNNKNKKIENENKNSDIDYRSEPTEILKGKEKKISINNVLRDVYEACGEPTNSLDLDKNLSEIKSTSNKKHKPNKNIQKDKFENIKKEEEKNRRSLLSKKRYQNNRENLVSEEKEEIQSYRENNEKNNMEMEENDQNNKNEIEEKDSEKESKSNNNIISEKNHDQNNNENLDKNILKEKSSEENSEKSNLKQNDKNIENKNNEMEYSENRQNKNENKNHNINFENNNQPNKNEQNGANINDNPIDINNMKNLLSGGLDKEGVVVRKDTLAKLISCYSKYHKLEKS